MKIERKKLILIIAAIITVVFGSIVIALSIMTGGSDEPAPTPTTTVQPDDSEEPTTNPDALPDDGATAAPDPEATDNPAPNVYENTYTDDVGYAPLPENFNVEGNPAGTVLDETWAMDRYHTLVCELSTKPSSTEKALKPIKDFYNDLSLAKHPNASTMRATIGRWIEDYERDLGERAPGNAQAEMTLECEYGGGAVE